MRYELAKGAPTNALTCVVPYRGTDVPDVVAKAVSVETGADRVEVEVSGFGKSWRIGRDLGEAAAWCEEMLANTGT